MNDRKLLLISYDFPPSTGGIARLCHEIVSNLQETYQQIHVLTIKKERVAIPYQDLKKVSITYLPAQRGKAEIKALQWLKQWPYKATTDVICGVWHPDAALAVLGGMKNIYVLAHGTELLAGASRFRKYLWHPLYAKWVLGKATKVIANSHYTQDLVNSINPDANTIALPLGVNPNFFKPIPSKKEKGKLKLCTVSRILQFKGHDFILKTLENLPKIYREKIEWHIAGTGSYLQELKQLAQTSAIAKQVIFHGFVPDKDLPKFYNQHDLFILATREQPNSTSVEGFGLVFLEAQACGLPVIGTRTGGIPDAIDENQGGFLIEQDHEAQLQNLLIRFIDRPKYKEELGNRARKRVEDKANWQVYIHQLKQILDV